MWLPTPFYDRAPHYWLLIGAMLVIVGAYLGLEGERLFMIFGLVAGVASCAWSLRIFLRRGRENADAEAASATGSTE